MRGGAASVLSCEGSAGQLSRGFFSDGFEFWGSSIAQYADRAPRRRNKEPADPGTIGVPARGARALFDSAGSELLTSLRVGTNRAHKPEAQAKGVLIFLSFNALRLRFRLVASDLPGIACILDGVRPGL